MDIMEAVDVGETTVVADFIIELN
jgi:hypothetical protein